MRKLNDRFCDFFVYLLKRVIIRDEVVNMLTCNVAVWEFEIQSNYYVQFRTNRNKKRLTSD